MSSDQSSVAVKKFTFYPDSVTRVGSLRVSAENPIVLLDGKSKEYILYLNLTLKEGYLQASLSCFYTLEDSPFFGHDHFIMYEIALLDVQDYVRFIKKGSCNLATIRKDEHFVEICTENEFIWVQRSTRFYFESFQTFSISLKSIIGTYQDILQQTRATKELPLARERLFDYYKNLYETKDFSDIILAIGSQEIPAHKGILAARSPVFRAMFGHSFKEATENRVEITDIAPDVMEEVIRFIYTSECPMIEEKPMEMLAAADKYDIESLRLLCEEVLSEQLDKDNAIDLLLLADRHSATVLKEKAIDVIRHNKNIYKDQIKLIAENSPRLSELLKY